MTPRLVVPLLVASLVSLTLGQEPQASRQTIRQIAECMRRSVDLEKRRLAATRGPRDRDRMAQRRAMGASGLYDAEKVDYRRQKVNEHAGSLERIACELASASITDPAERRAKLRELEVEIAAGREAAKAEMVPFEAERIEMREEDAPVRQMLEKLAEPVGRLRQDLLIAGVDVNMRMVEGRITVTWRAPKGNGMAKLNLWLISLAEPKEPVMKLAGTHPVQEILDRSVYFWVDTLWCSLQADKDDWRDQKGLPELAEALIDFEALADLESALRSTKGLRDQISERKRKHWEWYRGMRSAMGPVERRLRAKRRRITELRQPYDVTRVVRLEGLLAARELELAHARAVLGLALIEAPDEREAALAKALEEVKQARQDALEAVVPLRAELALLKRWGRYAEFSAWQLVDGIVGMPKGMGFIETVVKPVPKRGLVGVEWLDLHSNPMASACLRFEPAPHDLDAVGTLAGKYPLALWENESIGLWAGGVNVEFRVQRPEWQGKNEILEVAMGLLDLGAIASWPRIEDVE